MPEHHGPEAVLLTDEGVEMLQEFAPHFDEWPVPTELATLVAMLVKDDKVALLTIADAVNRPLYLVTGWAAQGGHLTEYNRLRHEQIREAIKHGARTIDEVADRIGLGRERVRQLTYCMTDMEEVYSQLRVKPIRRVNMPIPVTVKPRPLAKPTIVVRAVQQEIPAPRVEVPPAPEIVLPTVIPDRQLTVKERAKLMELVARAAAVPRNAPPRARMAIGKRDKYVRSLYDDGVSTAELAKAAGVRTDSIRDWTSPAKAYRRQLVTKAIARKQRAKRL